MSDIFGRPPTGEQHVNMVSLPGQKEIFDTAVIGGLLKAVRDDCLVDRCLGKAAASPVTVGAPDIASQKIRVILAATLPGFTDKLVTLDDAALPVTLTIAEGWQLGDEAGTLRLMPQLLVGTIDELVADFRERLTLAATMQAGLDMPESGESEVVVAERKVRKARFDQLQATLLRKSMPGSGIVMSPDLSTDIRHIFTRRANEAVEAAVARFKQAKEDNKKPEAKLPAEQFKNPYNALEGRANVVVLSEIPRTQPALLEAFKMYEELHGSRPAYVYITTELEQLAKAWDVGWPSLVTRPSRMYGAEIYWGHDVFAMSM